MYEHVIEEHYISKEISECTQAANQLLQSLTYKDFFVKYQSLWSDHCESNKTSNRIRFISELFPLRSFYNNISSYYNLMLEIENDIKNNLIPPKQMDSTTNRINKISNVLRDCVLLFVGASLLDFYVIGDKYQTILGGSTIDGCGTLHALNAEKKDIQDWLESGPLQPHDNDSALRNLLQKMVFKDDKMICTTFGKNGVSYKITKAALQVQIKTFKQSIVDTFNKFYKKNINNVSLQLFRDFETCFDWKNYKGYAETEMANATKTNLHNLVEPLVKELKTSSGRVVPPIIDSSMIEKEYLHLQHNVLFANRLEHESISTSGRIERLYHLILSKHQSKYQNVLRLIEWYTSKRLQMIDNERLNSKRSLIMSNYKQNMTNEMLCAILRLQ